MRSVTSILLSWLLVAAALPQTQQQRTNAPLIVNGGTKFETTTQLVVEIVNVVDKSGNPIKGLTKKDFSITEDGKPQEIKFCDFQELDTTPAPEDQLKQRPAAVAAASKEETKPAEPAAIKSVNSISPEKPGDLKYKDRRLMVMFFDLTAMPIPDQIRAQTHALKFLKTDMTASDLMAIMTFSSDIKVVEDFTGDRDQLTKDIKNLIIGEGQGFDVTTADDSTSDTGAAFSQDDTEFNIFNTDRQLSALETAVKMLGSLNEKKALVYFTSGITKSADNQAQMQATINAAIRSNVNIYTIDARGLVATAPLGDATKSSPGGQGMYSGSSARSATSNFQGQQETLYSLAEDTGGKALLDNNDLSMGLIQAQKDISSYYILTYNPTNTALDGHFRRIKISLNNGLAAKIGKPITYRAGYYANKDYSKFTSTDREHQLQEALMLGDPVTDIDIAMEIDYFRLARDRYFIPVQVKIPGSELALAKHGGAETTRVEFIGQIKDAKGAIVQNVRDTIDVKLKEATAAQLAKSPLAYDTGFALAPGTYSLKFLARDNETGKMGTFDTRFTIPDLTSEQKRLPISSVVLSSQRTELSAAVFSAERDKKLLESNPLVQGGQKLVPSVTRVFKKDQDMYVYLEAYEPTAESTQPLVATVSFYRGKVKAFETAPLQVAEGLNAKSKAVPLRFSFPLAKLQPGRYDCQVSVLDPSGQKFNFWRAPVMVLP
jgi:VWFA-related protein